MEDSVPEITVELAVGDVLQIGNRTVTVIEIEGSEVHFRVDDDPSSDPQTLTDLLKSPKPLESLPHRQKPK